MSGIKFSNTTPAAPGGMALVTFQADGNGNISAAYTPGGGGGGWTPIVSKKTANYTAVINDVVLCDTSGGGFTVTLPASASNGNGIIIIKKISLDANVVTVARSSADLIDGQTSQSISAQYTAMEVIADGISNWEII